ncbi:MAG: hypothetical protein GY820_35140 [Gammaproteobacteria bacterium]|nr:hypothetical protein [Gammaproteobacteria bacterium]
MEQRPIKIEREGKAVGGKMGRGGGRWEGVGGDSKVCTCHTSTRLANG